MKYPLIIREVQGSKRLVLPVVSRHPRSFGTMECFIDTGSPRTIMVAADAIKLGIAFSKYPETKSVAGFGKGNMPCVEIQQFPLVIRSNENTSKELKINVVVPNVPEMRKRDKNTLNHSLMLPTLIGLDFLEVNHLKMHINLSQNEAYLED